MKTIYSTYGSTHAAILLSVVLCGVLIQSCSAAPANVQTRPDHRPVRSDTLWTILRDLEDAIFRLKEYALRVDLESSRKETTNTENDDPLAEFVENSDRHMDESYPEVVSELQHKKSVDDAADVKVDSTTTTPKAEAAGKPEGNAVTTPATAPAHAGSHTDNDDISLREALEFLVSLAKQKKKQQKRDHDIPFPFTNNH